MDPLSETLAQITEALDHLKIQYAVGGSVASSARSIWRSTQDVDIVAAIGPIHVDGLVRTLGANWYADPDEIRRSIQLGRAFNLIHIGHAIKVDIFPAAEDFHHLQLERATVVPLGLAAVPCVVTTAEDILLAKLRWYRDGGEVSDRQWSDIVTLLANTNNLPLDAEYLDKWAKRLRVSALLERARADVNK
jgi:hypothetical protein